jgi:hypothetical protein
MQPQLFDFTSPDCPPAKQFARADHPETSKLAAENILPSLGKLEEWAAACVQIAPGSTAKELAKQFSPDNPERLWKRLSGARRQGRVRNGEARVCGVTGAKALTWWPV